MPDILNTILATKRQEIDIAQALVPMSALRNMAEHTPPARDFVGALRSRIAQQTPAVIAEIKRASPSKGLLRADFQPAAIARTYARHGAACLSVLTDRDYFQGDDSYLVAARAACDLPVLRKDFVMDAYQVYQARQLGADCILLIVAALPLNALRELEAIAHALGMAVLVESHDEAELGLALQLNTPLIGINNRNLRTFETRLDTTLGLLSQIDDKRLVITESGIHQRADVTFMQSHQVFGFLVGEALMRAPDPGAELKTLFFPDSVPS
jgi:indole-3-glycerol phosphate synthase